MLVSQDRENLNSARRTTNELLQNLRRIRTLVEQAHFNRVETDLCTVSNQIDAAIMRINDANVVPAVTQRLPRTSLRGRNIFRGAPRYQINETKLEYFLSIGMSIRHIARNSEHLLGGVVHYNTLHRFITRNGMVPPRQRFIQMNEDELRHVIQRLNRQYPNSGAGEMLGLLQSQTPSIRVQRDVCRRILAEIDPVGTARRWSQAVRRRQYSVPSPNWLWHLDTNHALIRWNIVIHAGIDGYSRLIPFARATSDNTALTALRIFITGLREFGVPSRIRTDGGSEYNFVRGLMDAINGEGRGSAIVGRSVHNQRIERLWRDVFAKVLEKYYKLFHHMEDHRILNITNDMHLYCLQYTFIPRIQENLTLWTRAHNNHRLRTEHNRTPLQLWHSGSLEHSHNNNTAMNNLFRRNLDNIGQIIARFFRTADLAEPGDIAVVLPRVARPLTNAQFENLQRIDVLADSQSDGLDIYGTVFRYVSQCMQ
eukprot:gene4922-5569_t